MNKPKIDNTSFLLKSVGGALAILGIIGVAFFIGTGFFISEIKQITSSTPSTTFDNPIPYIFPRHFHNRLQDYVRNATHSQVLLVLGPSGSGKSRGLNIFQQELCQRNNSFILYFDFKVVGENIKSEDLIFSLHKDISASIRLIDQLSSSSKNFPAQQILPVLEKYVSSLVPLTNLSKPPFKKFDNPLLRNVTQLFYTIVDQIPKHPSLAFRVFLEASEAIARLVSIPVVIVISEPENLIRCSNSNISSSLSRFWEIQREFILNGHSLPVIVEVSDQSSIVLKTHLPSFDHDMFLFLYNDEFRFEEAEEILVKKDKIFTKTELQLLYETVGGHGQSIARAHELAREGFTLGEIAGALRDNAKEQVMRALKTAKNESLCTHFLKKVAKKNLPVNYDKETAVYFLKNRITTLVNETKVMMANKALKRAVEDATSLNNK